MTLKLCFNTKQGLVFKGKVFFFILVNKSHENTKTKDDCIYKQIQFVYPEPDISVITVQKLLKTHR